MSESFTEITPGYREEALELLTQGAGSEQWVIVTSRNAVNYWNQLIAPQSLHQFFEDNQRINFAAIGSGSAQALEFAGATEVLVPAEQSSRGLLDLLDTYRPSTAILPQGNLARSVLSEGLRGKGWQVHTGVVYLNSPVKVTPVAAGGILQGDFSLIILRSPSAARALAHFLPNSILPVICGDSYTAESAAELSLNIMGVADDPSPESISNLVARVLEE